MAETSKKLVFDESGKHYYETGVRKVVLFPKPGVDYAKGVAWNGITSISESPTGAEATPLYAGDTKYLNLVSNEEFGAGVEAYTYPDEFAQCDGSAELIEGVAIGQQSRIPFGLAYRTTLGNDTNGNEYGYKLHFIYNALAAPSEKAYSTINDSPEAITFSWDITTTPVEVTTTLNGKTLKPTASLVIDSTKFADEAGKKKLKAIEDAIYGTETTEPRMLLPDEIVELMNSTVA